jgi:hypothetical protein
MAILMQRGEARRRQRVSRTIDNGPYSHPRETGLLSHLDNPSSFHIHRTRPTSSSQVGFSGRIGHELVGGDQYALLHRQLLSNGCCLDLVNEVAIRGSHFPGRILAYKRCADDQGPSGELWGETPSKSEAHQGLWREAMDEQTRSIGSACTPHPSLHGHVLGSH